MTKVRLAIAEYENGNMTYVHVRDTGEKTEAELIAGISEEHPDLTFVEWEEE